MSSKTTASLLRIFTTLRICTYVTFSHTLILQIFMEGKCHMPNYRYYSSRQPSRQQQYSNSRTASCTGAKDSFVCCNDNSKYDELSQMPLAMAYVPWQKWCSLYEADKGFCRGTIFEQLDKPFRGIGGYVK